MDIPSSAGWETNLRNKYIVRGLKIHHMLSREFESINTTFKGLIIWVKKPYGLKLTPIFHYLRLIRGAEGTLFEYSAEMHDIYVFIKL